MIRVVLFGSSDFGLPSFSALIADPRFSCLGVVTQPPRPKGRRAELAATPVDAWAGSNHLPVWRWPTLKSDEPVQVLSNLKADYFVVAAYGLILPPAILNLPAHGCVNIHGSVLPRYRGASPIAAALLDGELETGITIMAMDEGVDTGAVLSTYSTPIAPNDTSVTLSRKLADLAADHLPDDLERYCTGQLPPHRQDERQASQTHRITKSDGQADWRHGQRVERQLRAFQPWPEVWTSQGQEIIKILAGRFQPQAATLPAGTVIAYHRGLAVAGDDGIFIVETLQREGRRPVSAEEFVRAYPKVIGAVWA